MVDLHIHTTCSDGTDEPVEILKKAEALGLTHISITDHCVVDAYFKIEDAKKYYSGKIIKGTELECVWRGRLVELLGYGIDIVKMKEVLDGVYPSRMEVSKWQMIEMRSPEE